jgi:hypothetical protein
MGAGTDRAGYRERLHVPGWSWLLPVVFAIPLLLSPLVPTGVSEVVGRGAGQTARAAVVGGVVLGGGTLLLALIGRVTVSVAGGRLSAAGRALPAAEVVGVKTLDAEGVRRALGPQGDPSALRVTRPWVRTAVYVTTSAGQGWLLSTRHPELLSDALGRARSGALAPPR